jgi:hypothetical protein
MPASSYFDFSILRFSVSPASLRYLSPPFDFSIFQFPLSNFAHRRFPCRSRQLPDSFEPSSTLRHRNEKTSTPKILVDN